MKQTLFDKLWETHKITSLEGGEDLVAIDRVFLHERTGAATLKALQDNKRQPFDPSRVYCMIDHIVSIQEDRGRDDARSPNGEDFIRSVRDAAKTFGLRLFDTDDPNQGITHVIAPELGIALPGLTVVCPDSHTCSLGGIGALAWGVGSSTAEHAIASGTLRVKRPKQMRVQINGELSALVTAKDVALYLISQFGADGGQRCAIEFCGPVIDAMPIEERLTLCNMAVEFSAFTAIIAPDERVIDYMLSRPNSPTTQILKQGAAQHWRNLASDAGAEFDKELEINADDITPMITWGTSPQDAISVDGKTQKSTYMQLARGENIAGKKIDAAFIGSCTNGRLSDLKNAAQYLQGKRVADHVRAICVPGSQKVKQQAEQDGLDKIFKAAGFEWGASGCAYCFYAGGSTFPEGARVISSTNRNFESRQGPNVRTHLASPATVAASAVAGMIVDITKVDVH